MHSFVKKDLGSGYNRNLASFNKPLLVKGQWAISMKCKQSKDVLIKREDSTFQKDCHLGVLWRRVWYVSCG